MKPTDSAERPEDCAAAWFLVLEKARDDQDWGRAAEAQTQLRRLGVEVRFISQGARGRKRRRPPR